MMLPDVTWQNVLEDWAHVVHPFVQAVIDNGMFPRDDPWCFEYRGLDNRLQQASLQEIDAFLPDLPFGSTGSGISVLKPEASLWLLPVLLRFGSVSEDSTYATSVVDVLRQKICRLETWPEIKSRLSDSTRTSICEIALECCKLGWQDERRVAKRGAECRIILV